jgi:hydroxymethylpyrimidine/phosphomethylpyrimidine kinase
VTTPPLSRVLIIAGSDSGGGAGIQGDLKTVTCLGGYGMTAITALTAQNTMGVFGIHPIPPEFVAQQIQLCLSDIGADAIKTGMLYSADIIETVAAHLPPGIPLVVDPVMIAKGGAALLEDAATQALKTRLIPKAALLTPNLPEAEYLLGKTISGVDAMIGAANALLGLGSQAVLLKGGHGDGDTITDVLQQRGEEPILLKAKRINTNHTHGTGCSLASAIATGLAQGMALKAATTRAHAYIQAAIGAAPGLGHGHGPLGHFTTF